MMEPYTLTQIGVLHADAQGYCAALLPQYIPALQGLEALTMFSCSGGLTDATMRARAAG